MASAIIGKGVRIKGELSGSVDLAIEGEVEGKVAVEQALVIEPDGGVVGEVSAPRLVVRGRLDGHAAASERVELASSSVVLAEIEAPSLVIEDGAVFNGTVRMELALPEGV